MTSILNGSEMCDRPREDRPYFDVVDVGHGNCTLICDAGECVMIDAGPGKSRALEYLRDQGHDRIGTVILSHADADHISGMIALLGSDLEIGTILVNSDGNKNTDLWLDLVYELDARHNSGSSVMQWSYARIGDRVECGNFLLEILAPRPRLALIGPGGTGKDGRVITANSASVVVAVKHLGQPVLLAPGDIDAVGYSHWEDSSNGGVDEQYPYVILPHHGGLLGSAAETAEVLNSLVRRFAPTFVFVANGTNRNYRTPRPEVISALPASTVQTIMCTQLAEACGARGTRNTDELPIYGHGRANGASCAGSIRVQWDGGRDFVVVRLAEHARFVRADVPQAMCIALRNGFQGSSQLRV